MVTRLIAHFVMSLMAGSLTVAIAAIILGVIKDQKDGPDRGGFPPKGARYSCRQTKLGEKK